MGPMTALLTTDYSSNTATAIPEPKRSFARTCIAALTILLANARRAASDRRMRDQLADMDDAMLKDIGIADDELHMIRARYRFTPRAWASASMNGSGWAG